MRTRCALGATELPKQSCIGIGSVKPMTRSRLAIDLSTLSLGPGPEPQFALPSGCVDWSLLIGLPFHPRAVRRIRVTKITMTSQTVWALPLIAFGFAEMAQEV